MPNFKMFYGMGGPNQHISHFRVKMWTCDQWATSHQVRTFTLYSHRRVPPSPSMLVYQKIQPQSSRPCNVVPEAVLHHSKKGGSVESHGNETKRDKKHHQLHRQMARALLAHKNLPNGSWCARALAIPGVTCRQF